MIALLSTLASTEGLPDLTHQAVDLILGVVAKAGLSEPEKTDAHNLLVIIQNHSQTLCLYQIIDFRTIGFSRTGQTRQADAIYRKLLVFFDDLWKMWFTATRIAELVSDPICLHHREMGCAQQNSPPNG
jgi:hypothetical protein